MRTVEDRVAFLHKALDPALKLKAVQEPRRHQRGWAIRLARLDGGRARTSSLVGRSQPTAGKSGRRPRSSPLTFHSLENRNGRRPVAVRGDDVVAGLHPGRLALPRGASEGKATKPRPNYSAALGVHIGVRRGNDMHGTKIGAGNGRLYWDDRRLRRARDDQGKARWSTIRRERRGPSAAIPMAANMELLRHGPAQSAVPRLQRPRRSFHWRQPMPMAVTRRAGPQHRGRAATTAGRIGWQFLPKLGPWNSEGMWHLDNNPTNLAVLPPRGPDRAWPRRQSRTIRAPACPDSFCGSLFLRRLSGRSAFLRLEAQGAPATTVEKSGRRPAGQQNLAK